MTIWSQWWPRLRAKSKRTCKPRITLINFNQGVPIFGASAFTNASPPYIWMFSICFLKSDLYPGDEKTQNLGWLPFFFDSDLWPLRLSRNTFLCRCTYVSQINIFFTYLLAFLDGQNSIKLLYPALEDCKFFVRTNALFCWYKLKILYYVHVPYLKVELVEEVVVWIECQASGRRRSCDGLQVKTEELSPQECFGSRLRRWTIGN